MNLAGIDDGYLIVVGKNSKSKLGEIIVVLDDDNYNTLKRLAQIVQEGRFCGGWVYAILVREEFSCLKISRTGTRSTEHFSEVLQKITYQQEKE